MANPKHLEILMRGVEAWNTWRGEASDVIPDLSEAQCWGISLGGADLSGANLNSVDFRQADLAGADLGGASLMNAILSYADLHGATFLYANLNEASLNGANLSKADFYRANLSLASLTGANLREAELGFVNLSGAELENVDVRCAYVGHTSFVDNNLSSVIGLEHLNHVGPSFVDIYTLYNSDGKIPEEFLRGCGVPEDFITYARLLTTKAIEFYSCFVSYSSKDQKFADKLHTHLQANGVRCWFAPHDLRIGDKIRPRIDESIRLHDKLLLILSKHSVASDWVEQEVETALDRERREKHPILFPIRLDDAVMKIDVGWPALIKNARNIGDFRGWRRPEAYQTSFNRLLRDLKAEE